MPSDFGGRVGAEASISWGFSRGMLRISAGVGAQQRLGLLPKHAGRCALGKGAGAGGSRARAWRRPGLLQRHARGHHLDKGFGIGTECRLRGAGEGTLDKPSTGPSACKSTLCAGTQNK